VNIYSDRIGENLQTGEFVEICKGAIIGNNVKIGSHTFIPDNVIIKDDVFIGQGVMFTNDKFPPSHGAWKETIPTVVGKGSSVGSGSIILPSMKIGKNTLVGAGTIITKDVPDNTIIHSIQKTISRKRI
jgi:acetyltransferase-like isoleucine patch superfamily enzyme